MQERYSKPSEELITSSDDENTSEDPTCQKNSFFNISLRAQPSTLTKMEVGLDPTAYQLLTAIYKELKLQNELTQQKIQREDDQKKQEIEAEQLTKTENEKRFSEIKHSIFT